MLLGGAQVAGSLLGLFNANEQRKDAKRQAQREHDLAERQLQGIEDINRRQQQRFDQNFRPIEDSIASELRQGPDLEGAARLAGDTFAGEFDQSIAAQERQLRQFGIRPDSAAFARATEDQAFQRAAGTAQARNHARREEEDRHFVQRLGFLGSGSGIQGQVANSLQNTYGIRSNNAANYAADAASSSRAIGQFGSSALQGAGQVYNAYQNRDSGTGANANNAAKAAGQYGQVATESPTRDIRQQVNP